MADKSKALFIEYQKSHETSYLYLQRGLEIIKNLLNYNFESYIVGSAVRSLYLNSRIYSVEILTKATPNDLKAIYPKLIVNSSVCRLVESCGNFDFCFFEDDNFTCSVHNESYFNQKLSHTLVNRVFAIDSICITPNQSIIDLYNGVNDLNNHILRTIEKPKLLFKTNPKAIIDTLAFTSNLGFALDSKTKNAIIKYSYLLSNLDTNYLINSVKNILVEKDNKEVIKFINKNKIFSSLHDFDLFFKRIASTVDDFNMVESLSLLYLIIGSIPNAKDIDEKVLFEITENMTFTKLIISNIITPMMVYNIGVDRLLSANKIALCYKSKYDDQERLIKKLSRKLAVENMRELNFSALEVITLLNGERSIKVKLILNLLLEKVLNGDIPNYYPVLKSTCKEIIRELNEIFDYEDTEGVKEYTDEEVKELLQKYQKEYDFLVKVYLNDERELYSLTQMEREETIREAYNHAKDFLTGTSQYKVLIERGLI